MSAMRSDGIWSHTDVFRAADEVIDRLPAQLTVAGVTLEPRAAEAEPGTYGRHARSVPVRWSSGRREGDGHLEVAPLASDRTQLLLHLGPPAGGLLQHRARALLDGLRDRLDGPAAIAPTAPSRPAVPRRRVVPLAAALALPAVLLGFFVLLPSPTPVSVDDRVAQFRSEQSALDGGADADPSPTPDASGDGSTTPDDGEPAAAPVADSAPDAGATGPDEQSAVSDTPSGERSEDQGSQSDPAQAAGEEDRATEDDGTDPATDDPEPAARPRVHPPDPGVYRYATTGGERLDVRGSARDYPETTTITVRRDDCGFTERWDVFEERWEERAWCVEDQHRPLVGMTSYREFFGHGQRNELTCDGEDPEATAMGPGTAWEVVCEDDATTATSRLEVLAAESVDVDGATLDTWHLRMETRIEGETNGHMTAERWVVAETGLLVREDSETEVETAGPFGPVTYTEEFSLQLESAAPVR